ncbi:MAG: 50S ribosome-binding GTPase [Nocardiopsaceae bacterium]|nr:50S ribosome-binding GTPase [Nocardiopsaceae bacterium]
MGPVRAGSAGAGSAGAGSAGAGSAGAGSAGVGSVRSAGRPGLRERLDAVAELTRIGQARPGFDPRLLAESGTVLGRAVQRLRLSDGHTVVAIAGGTGSGKSTLFNALAGAEFSPPGVTRPATRDVHACVWGNSEVAPLLDWLGVGHRQRFARASALDSGEEELRGLVLLDLPDHDSVVAASAEITDRIAALADMLIWVLDPQKYADAAVHNRYLVPLAGHAGVLTVVLSQADLLTEEEADACGEDLRRLLDSEGLNGVRLCTVSGRTGAGLDEVRGLLADAVAAGRASDERISADVEALLGRYAAYAAGPIAGSSAASGSSGLAGGSSALAGDSSGGPAAGAGEDVADEDGGGAFPAPVPADSAQPSGPAQPGGRPSRPPWELTEEDRTAPDATRNRPSWPGAAPGTQVRPDPDPADLARNVPEGPAAALTGAFVGASGLDAVADGRASAWEARAARLTSWPLAPRRWTNPRRSLDGPARSPGGPVRSPGGSVRSPDGASAGTGPVSGAGGTGGAGGGATSLAPQSEVDNAITTFADAIGRRLPDPWPASIIGAARSRADQVPPALAEAVRVPGPGQATAAPLRWRLIAAGQWLLLAIAAVALLWAAAIGLVVTGVIGRLGGLPFGDGWFLPWLAAAVAVALVLGWLISVGCRNMAEAAGDRERERAAQAMREAVTAVTRDLVLVPTGREIAAYERFRRELSVARGDSPAAYGESPAAYGGAGTPAG